MPDKVVDKVDTASEVVEEVEEPAVKKPAVEDFHWCRTSSPNPYDSLQSPRSPTSSLGSLDALSGPPSPSPDCLVLDYSFSTPLHVKLDLANTQENNTSVPEESRDAEVKITDSLPDNNVTDATVAEN